MYKDWTFLLNARRNAKKGKCAKDMSWIVNATGGSRLASPISRKQCTHPLRRVCVILDIVGVQETKVVGTKIQDLDVLTVLASGFPGPQMHHQTSIQFNTTQTP